jgi:hypothetical protein
MTTSLRAGLFRYLLVPGAFFLLGSLATWYALRQPTPEDRAEGRLPAPEAEGPSPPGEPAEVTAFQDNTRDVVAGAATLAGAGGNGRQGLAMEIALLRAGERAHLWKLEDTDKALSLNPKYLAGVIDGTPLAMLPSFRAEGGQGPVPDLKHVNEREALAFCDALIKANLTSAGAFANSARSDLTPADLANKPREFRGEVVHGEGRLRRVRHSDPPPNARARGVDHLYEGWVLDPRYGSNPVCLVFTELPPGVRVAEQADQDVAFDAYFFKKYRYQSADSKPGFARETPLFIGRSPVLLRGPAAEPGPPAGSAPLLTAFLGLVVATVALAFGLTWWFRRGDRRVREQLAAVRRREFVDPGTPNLPDTTPSPN